MTPAEFIKKYSPYAKAAERSTGVPFEFIIAQSGLETGWGNSTPGNMFFGIKATKNWKGKRQLLRTTEIVYPHQLSMFPEVISTTPIAGGKVKAVVRDYFRAYDSPKDSFEDHISLLKARYAGAFNYSDPYRVAEEVARAGYATAPNYADALKNAIRMVQGVPASKPKEESNSKGSGWGFLFAGATFGAVVFFLWRAFKSK